MRGREMFSAVARGVLADLLPAEPAARSRAIQAHLQRLDDTIAGLPPALQAEIDELVTLLASMPGRLVAGRTAHRLAAGQRSRVAGHAAGPADLVAGVAAAGLPRACATSRTRPTSPTPAPGRPSATRAAPGLRSDRESNMSSLPDPIQAGLERGWKVLGGRHGALPESVVCDVAIVGTGAGAGITAELLTAAGLSVVLIEEGPAAQQPRLQPDRGRGLPGAVPGQRQPADGRQGHLHPAGPLRRRLDHRQLDEFVPHAAATR